MANNPQPEQNSPEITNETGAQTELTPRRTIIDGLRAIIRSFGAMFGLRELASTRTREGAERAQQSALVDAAMSAEQENSTGSAEALRRGRDKLHLAA